LLSHPEISDEPDNDEPTAHVLGGQHLHFRKGEIRADEQTAQSLVCNDCSKLFRDAAAAERHATRTSHQNFSESTESIKPLTEEEKKQKLAELKARLAEKRALKAMQEEEERKALEKMRRRTGQEISQLKEELEAKEMKKVFEAKRREKEEDRLAKAKIKAQIEADKRERMAKREAAKQQQQQQQQQSASANQTTPSSKQEYHEARLQVSIRAPGMAPIVKNFDANAKLSEVHDYLNSQGINAAFSLGTTFPRKVFTEEHQRKTLKDLGSVLMNLILMKLFTQCSL
ncbi:uncharacterized protein BYT42DRAFT_488077, partial [Radiomyces spectabilis]|uniref:uncharacterized protein n=1 Tax=Radiomyces spectabilis TaxID=64574 RepID=UPI0022208766